MSMQRRVRDEVARVEVDPERGLTSAQVEERRRAGLDNRPVKTPSKSVPQIVASNVFTYFNLVFAVLGVLVALTGSYRDLTFLPVVVANALIGIVQELRAKRVLDRLTVLHAPTTIAVRDGNARKVPSSELVRDDVVRLSAGDQVPADATVLAGAASANESLLTGESAEVAKAPGDVLMSGSFLVSGSCAARLDKVGADSYVSRLTLQAKAARKGEQSQIVRDLDRIVKVAGILIIPVGIGLYLQAVANGYTWNEAILSMVAAVVGMIPEGLFLLASITLALSAVRLAGKKVLVHEMKCIETLARVDTLCVDKTGTITEPHMSVSEVLPLGGRNKGEVEGLLADFACAQDADNATMAALKARFASPAGRAVNNVSGFSSEYKYSAVTFEGEGTFVLGAPEFVLREGYAAVSEDVERLAGRGFRVLVLGSYEGEATGGALDGLVEPRALVTLANPIRKTAPATFGFFASQGVEVKVISGDNPKTVSEVARAAGIQGAESYVDASTLTSDEALERAANTYTVFGRVTPDQKRALVRALKTQGHTVAMTGDGVNDVLALRDADCSVAMASGSDAAAQAAQLVLLDSDFSHMPDVVMEGRQTVNNLQRSGSLFLVKNVFSLVCAVISICVGMTYPLTAAQVSLISMFTIGVPAFLLSLVPDHGRIQGRFITNIVLNAIPGGLTDVVAVMAMVAFGDIFGVSAEEVATASTALLAVVGLMVTYRISRPMTPYKWGVLALCAAGLIVGSHVFYDLFAISDLSTKSFLLCLDFALLSEPCLRYLTLAEEALVRLVRRGQAMDGDTSAKAESR